MENREFNEKPKCPVFGCTILRGIPHEHPQQQAGIERFLDGIPLNRLDQFESGPMAPGRSLREALLMAGTITLRDKPIKPEIVECVDRINLRWNSQQGPAPRHSFVSTVALVAFWIVLAVTVVTLAVLSVMPAEWL